MQFEHLIFDFDGTLVDSFGLHLELFNTLAQKYGRPEVTAADVEQYRQHSAQEFFRAIGIPLYRLPGLLDEGRQLLEDKFDQLKLFPGMKQVLEELALSKTLAVISSTPEPILRAVLEKEGVLSLFSEVRGERDVFGKHRVIAKVMKQHHWPREKCVYIGDEVRDAEAAQKAKVAFVGVGWGFTDAERLSQTTDSIAIAPIDIKVSLT